MWSYCVLFGLLVAVSRPTKIAVRGDADSFVETYNVINDCSKSIKNVRNLKTGAAILIFDESQNLDLTDQSSFMCHYELETISGYGFHIYIDEMDFVENPLQNAVDPCTDYIQFGRDAGFVTTFKSPFYCGSRSRIATTNPAESGNVSTFTGGQGSRMYVEEKDSEMDVWIKVTPRSNPVQKLRKLYMTVTVIKKGCGAKNPYYRNCPNTQHCIRREFFCDSRINCAWPDADHGGTDEINCDAEEVQYNGPFNTMGATNIPLIIVLVIITTIFIVIGVVFGKKFISHFCKTAESRQGTHSRPSPPSDFMVVEATEITPALSPDHAPSSPPSYEEVIKDNPGILSGGVHMTAPPPYTPSAPSSSMTTTPV